MDGADLLERARRHGDERTDQDTNRTVRVDEGKGCGTLSVLALGFMSRRIAILVDVREPVQRWRSQAYQKKQAYQEETAMAPETRHARDNQFYGPSEA